ncbi:MAG: molybdate ABC transporter permease subunit [Deltaproteobacteria bacterium]|nr:molybdate ABC transporter permease subunit [Deltaproteobacteria bacterium]
MQDSFYLTFYLTFKLALITTFILLIIGVPVAYYLAYTRARLKPVLETIVSMPLVLPPSVLGFYLLVTFGAESFLGGFIIQTFGVRLVFSFEGLVLGSVIFSLPFMVQPIQAGFEKIPESLHEAALTLGKSKFRTLFMVLLPNTKPSLITGVVLAFAHTIGEFGVVLMIGGNIPGVTRVASIAIYDEIEALNYGLANQYALSLFAITFLILLLVYIINRRFIKGS